MELNPEAKSVEYARDMIRLISELSSQYPDVTELEETIMRHMKITMGMYFSTLYVPSMIEVLNIDKLPSHFPWLIDRDGNTLDVEILDKIDERLHQYHEELRRQYPEANYESINQVLSNIMRRLEQVY